MAVDLGKQVGPLPLGAWIVVVGGGLGIAWYTKRSGTAEEPQIDTSGQPGVGDGSVGGWVPQAPVTGTQGVEQVPTTNEEWAYRAKQVLIAANYPPTTVSSAIDKYINGQTLSVAEFAMVGIALGKVGPLPQTLPTTPDAPTQPNAEPWKNPPAPAAGSGRGYGWYKAVAGDTPQKIADKFNKTVAEIYLYNGFNVIGVGNWVKVRWNSNPFMGYKGS